MKENIQSQESSESFGLDDKFVDYYDFLGVPPASPPNLIYIAILKIQKALENDAFDESESKDIQKEIEKVYNHLLSEEDKRFRYEKKWQSHYFPRNEYQTNISSMKANSTKSTLLLTGLKKKSLPLDKESKQEDIFDYSKDFSYLMMCDRPKERNVFFLETEKDIHLPPYSDVIHFDKHQFFLSTQGEMKITIINDSLGKHIICSEPAEGIPLHIGDRMEFDSGTRLILRGFYTRTLPNNATKKNWGIHLKQENVIIPLDEEKVYIFGRNTSDIRNLAFDESLFCFVNIGRRERSISRQNFQIFYHQDSWYLKDLGSRYGTTLDFDNHSKFETLIGGSMMKLDIGCIRLGYDKSYIIEVDVLNKLQKEELSISPVEEEEDKTIYDIPLL